MLKSDYLTVAQPCENTVVVNKSRFITTLAPITSYDDAITKIKEISKRYSDATHNCYAFISNETATEQRFSDDGEPQGTAGAPMLEVLKKRKVYMTLAVVTRYFGGVKLGANGLVSAYSSSVSEALDVAKTVKMKQAKVVEITVAYGIYKKIQEVCLKFQAQLQNVDYGNDVKITAAVPQQTFEELAVKIVDISSDKAQIDILKSDYCAFDV